MIEDFRNEQIALNSKRSQQELSAFRRQTIHALESVKNARYKKPEDIIIEVFANTRH